MTTGRARLATCTHETMTLTIGSLFSGYGGAESLGVAA